jgi:hypothetical protein
LKDSLELSYGNDSHGFLLIARYKDSKYGAVCAVLKYVDYYFIARGVCNQLNITGGSQDQADDLKHQQEP